MVPRMTWRNDAAFIWLIVAAGVSLRLVYSFLAEVQPWSDFDAYDRMARNIIEGTGWHSRGLSLISPGYPVFLALVYLIYYGLAAAWVANSLLGGASIWLTYQLSTHLWDSKPTARVAACGTAFYPDYVVYAGLLASENLSIPLLASAVLMMLKADISGNKRNWGLAGVFLGGAILTRGMLLGIVPIFVAWIWWDVFRNRLRRALVPSLFLVLACTMVIVPWTVRNWVAHKAFVPITTQTGAGLWGGNNPVANGEWMREYLNQQGFPPGLSEVERSRYQTARALKYMIHNPWDVLLLSVKKLGLFWGIKMDGVYMRQSLIPPPMALFVSTLGQAAIVALFLLGVGMAWPWSRQLRCVLVATVYLCLLTMIFYYLTRYRLLLYVLWLPVAAYALLGIVPRIVRQREKSLVVYSSALTIVLLLDWAWIVWRNVDKISGFSSGSLP